MKRKIRIIFKLLMAAVALPMLMIAPVSCGRPQTTGNNAAQSNKNEAPFASTITATTTAYLDERGSRNGTYLTFTVGKFHIANVNVDSPDSGTKEFIGKLAEQINSGTMGGSITVNVGSNQLPLANDTWLNTDIHLVNNPYLDNAGFMGPKGNLSFNGSVKAKRNFDIDHFHVTNPGTSKVEISATNCNKVGEIITCHATPVSWEVPGWEWGSVTVTISNWNSTPANLQQLQNARIITNKIQFDAVADVVSAAQQVNIK